MHARAGRGPLTKTIRALALGLALTLAGSACGRGDDGAVGPPGAQDVWPDAVPPSRASVVLETAAGVIRCTIRARAVPRASTLFAGLARGRARWRDPASHAVVRRPLYRDLAFHRVIEGVLVQTGCPKGDGTGHPGYRIPVEQTRDDRALLRAPGALVLASYTAPPRRADPDPPPPGHVIGSQFGIALVAMPQLLGRVTVLGTCGDLGVVAAIARARDPARRPRLRRVRVREAR